jgi:hypothetical protein
MKAEELDATDRMSQSRQKSGGIQVGSLDRDSAYYIGENRRAMVSLGPVKQRNYCTFSCSFCYVQGPFPRYQRTTQPYEVVAWLEQRTDQFDTIYVSGDTDSFAPPRTEKALELLGGLMSLGRTVLFTTRHLFTFEQRAELERLAADYRAAEIELIGCVSISQLHHPPLEPYPIASPEDRIEQLGWLRDAGIVSVLTIRPFIPTIAAREYAEIAERGADSADLVLGGDWYVDPAGIILKRTEEAIGAPIVGRSVERSLDFSKDRTAWRIYSHPEAQRAVGEVCRDKNVPFFMRSDPALSHLRLLRK